MKKYAVLVVCLAAASLSVLAAEKVTFDDNVLPIFRNACNNCHNPDKKKAGLDLTTYQATLQGSENGKVVQSGNAAGSLLFKCVKQTEDPKMPPKGDKLNDQDLALIEQWIVGQLLENASGKAVAAVDNKVSVAVVSLTKPDGPPPMPGELSLEPVVHTQATNALTALAVSPWAPVVALGGQKQILLYHTETFEPLGVLPFPEGFPSILRFSRNGRLLLTGGGFGGKSGKVVLWDIKTGDRIATLGNEVDEVLAADLSPDQQFVALGGPTRLVKIYSTKNGKLVTAIKKHTDWVTAIAYSPDGKYLASADRNGGIQVWEGSTGKEFNSLPGHKVMVTGLAFMPGVLASSSEDGKIALWDVKEGKEIRSWTAHPGGAAWVDFTTDGRLASAGRDKLAKAWDQNGNALGKTEPFGDIALRAGLSNDRVIAGDWNGLVRVTNLAGKELAQLSINPPSLMERVTLINQRIGELQTAFPELQKRAADAAERVKRDKAAAEEKKSNFVAALEAAKSLPVKVEQRLTQANAELEKLKNELAAADETTRPTIQSKVDAQAGLIATVQAEQTKAADALRQMLTQAEANKAGETKLANQIAELNKQLEAQNADLQRLRQALGQQKSGTPGFTDVNAKVNTRAGEVAQTQSSLIVARKQAGQLPSDSEEAAFKAKSAMEDATQQLADARTRLDRWKLAQLFQTVHLSRQSLAQKQTAYNELVATVKEALEPVAGVKTKVAAAEKTALETARKVPEQEKVFAAAQAASAPASEAVGPAEVAVSDHEKALKAAIDAVALANAAALDGFTKQLAAQNAELGKLREARGAKAPETPEFAEAEQAVKNKQVEIAATTAALEAAKKTPKPADSTEAKTALVELTHARELLEKTRATARDASDKLIAAERELKKAKSSAEQAARLFAELQTRQPVIVKAAETAKREAEQALPAAERELATARAQAEKTRVDYEAAKVGNRSASIAAP